jgi:hypothetical protein
MESELNISHKGIGYEERRGYFRERLPEHGHPSTTTGKLP